MRIAAIDVGTNSVHLLVAEIVGPQREADAGLVELLWQRPAIGDGER